MSGAVTLQPRELHMEILNRRDFSVWLCQSPVTPGQYRAFRPAAPFVKSGFGRAAFDASRFTRSPGASQDGPVETRIIGGYSFTRVARPRIPDVLGLMLRRIARSDAPTKVRVEKHHEITFSAGRDVRIARLPDGCDYVEQTLAKGDAIIAPPEDWIVTTRKLEQDWTILLPTPCSVYFFRDFSSFAGPILL